MVLAGGGFFGHQWLVERAAAARRAEFLKCAARGNQLLEGQKFAEAIPPLEQAVALSRARPQADDLNAWCALATAYQGAGRISDAERTLSKAQERAAALPAVDLLRPDIVRSRVDLATALGNLLLEQGKTGEARQLFEWAVTAAPRDAAAHNNLANVLFLQGKFAEAEPHYDMAHALAPKDPETLYNWGVMLLKKKHRTGEDAVAAETNFREALALQPKTAKYLVGLGQALRAQGRFGPAIQALRTAMIAEPKFAASYTELADLDWQIGDYHGAESCLRSILSFDKNNRPALTALARLLTASPDPEQRDYLESISLYQQLIDLSHGRDVNFTVQLADTYALAKYYDKAEETIARAMKLAREQGVSGLDRELIGQRAQTYQVLQYPPAPAKIDPESTLDDPLGVGPQAPDPWDFATPTQLNNPLVHVYPAP